jgi:small-conductance mechanosensitive channel
MRLISNIFKKGFLPIALLILAVEVYVIFYGKLQLLFLKEALENFDKWIFTIFAVIAVFLIHRLASAAIDWYGLNIAEKTSTTLDDEFLPLMRKLVILLIWLIATLIILSRFGINTSGLIAALGVSSLAIALAAQDTISNIISGFLIIVDRPFRIDDTIKLPSGEKVKVLQIGLRRSEFLAEDGAIIIVPNLALSKSKIVNYTYGNTQGKK